MRIFLKFLPILFLLNGCLHSPPDYPGARGSSINPLLYADTSCPDFSGTYEAVGNLIDGDPTARQIERTNFSNTSKFVCNEGKMVWGGRDNIVARTEFGTNTGNRSYTIFLDKNGDLIYEEKQQVHMNILLGLVPAGTSEYFSIYRFKRISK